MIQQKCAYFNWNLLLANFFPQWITFFRHKQDIVVILFLYTWRFDIYTHLKVTLTSDHHKSIGIFLQNRYFIALNTHRRNFIIIFFFFEKKQKFSLATYTNLQIYFYTELCYTLQIVDNMSPLLFKCHVQMVLNANLLAIKSKQNFTTLICIYTYKTT